MKKKFLVILAIMMLNVVTVFGSSTTNLTINGEKVLLEHYSPAGAYTFVAVEDIENHIGKMIEGVPSRGDITYMPLREIAKLMGATVSFDNTTKIINLTASDSAEAPIIESLEEDNAVDLYADAKDIDEFGNLFKGRMNYIGDDYPNGMFEKMVIVSAKDITKYKTKTGQIMKFEYKDGNIYFSEKADQYTKASQVYIADSVNGLDRVRQDRNVESTTIIHSVLSEVSTADYLKYPDFKNYKFEGHAEYFVILSEISGIGLAIPVSEVIIK